MELEEKLAEIRDFLNQEELENIKAKMSQPDKVVCPLNKRYFQLPLSCTGYKYICPHLDRNHMVCDHPENRKWKVAHVSPGVKILTR